MSDCSLVIRAFNEERHLPRLLEGIRNQTVRNVELILVDSGSTDATVDIAEKYGVRVVHITPAEFTFGRSLNLGLAAASSPVVVIASAHVYPVYPDWLEKLISPFSDPRIALAYGRQTGTENLKIFRAAGIFPLVSRGIQSQSGTSFLQQCQCCHSEISLGNASLR